MRIVRHKVDHPVNVKQNMDNYGVNEQNILYLKCSHNTETNGSFRLKSGKKNFSIN